MPRLFNTDNCPQIVNHGETAVLPGESHDFTDEEVKAGIAGPWATDPRAGKAAEKAWKVGRDATPADNHDASEVPDPAPSGDEKE